MTDALVQVICDTRRSAEIAGAERRFDEAIDLEIKAGLHAGALLWRESGFPSSYPTDTDTASEALTARNRTMCDEYKKMGVSAPPEALLSARLLISLADYKTSADASEVRLSLFRMGQEISTIYSELQNPLIYKINADFAHYNRSRSAAENNYKRSQPRRDAFEIFRRIRLECPSMNDAYDLAERIRDDWNTQSKVRLAKLDTIERWVKGWLEEEDQAT